MKKVFIVLSLLSLLFTSAGLSRAGDRHRRYQRSGYNRKHRKFYRPRGFLTGTRYWGDYHGNRGCQCCGSSYGHHKIRERRTVYYPTWGIWPSW